MPTIAPGDKVLVTGANGFLAVHVVDILLKKGYAVRGVVRSLSKGDHLKKLFAEYGDKFELAVVKDITVAGAFDNVLNGIDAIAHTASPFHTHADDPNDIIIPAVNGTKSILETAVEHGSAIKRIVLTASTVAVGLDPEIGRQYTEEDWNEPHLKQVRELGKDATGGAKYSASKTLAERAAWEVYNRNKGSIGWDLTTLNPPYLFGPVIHAVEKPEDLNTSTFEWFKVIYRNTKSDKDLVASINCWVDVRDVAEAHVVALEKPEAGGERILFSAGPFTWQDFIDAARDVAPSLGLDPSKITKGAANYDSSKVTHHVYYSTEKRERILGIKVKSQKETTRDTLADFKARGWIA